LQLAFLLQICRRNYFARVTLVAFAVLTLREGHIEVFISRKDAKKK
jgi:hypothetical protein